MIRHFTLLPRVDDAGVAFNFDFLSGEGICTVAVQYDPDGRKADASIITYRITGGIDAYRRMSVEVGLLCDANGWDLRTY